MHLHGALFFGSVEQLRAQVQKLRKDVPDVHSVILDMGRVQTFDSSACAALGKLRDHCREAGVAVWLVDLAPHMLVFLRRWGLAIEARPGVPGLKLAASLDDALEAAEDDFLLGTAAETLQQNIVETLARWSNNHPRSAELAARMDRLELAADSLLIHADEQSQDVYLLEQGRLAIYAPNRRSGNDRMRSIGPGRIIGEMAYLTQSKRVAEVRAELASVVYRLKAEDIDKMRREDPELAALVAFVLGRTVSEKLAQTNRVLSNLRMREVD